MDLQTFPFRFHPTFRAVQRPLGITPASTGVRVEGALLVIDFGRWRVSTPLANVVSTEVTGPYAWPKVIGPPHLSFADRGLTFATNPDRGVCVRFEQPVRGMDPLGLLRHPGVTVTVADVPALVDLLGPQP
jgi:hypothetical protein